MPALPLFAQLRRFTLAVLAAAETAADFAGILYTDSPANGEADSAEPFEPIELEQRAMLTMPGGWKMSQLEAEQTAPSNLRRFQPAKNRHVSRTKHACCRPVGPFVGQFGTAA